MEERIEGAYKLLLNVTETSKNLRQDLKQDIVQAVSELRKAVAKLKSDVNDKNEELKNVRIELKKANDQRQTREYRRSMREVSFASSTGTSGTAPGPHQRSLEVATADGGRSYYSDVVRGKSNVSEEKSYKLFVKSKNNQSAEYIRTLVKTKVNPVQMKVGVKSCRAMRNGQILIESSNKDEADVMYRTINEKCGEELEAVMSKKRNPRIIIFNVGDDISMQDAAEALTSQNEQLHNYKEEVKPIFDFLDKKKNRNLVVEINSTIRNQMLGKKIKFSWNMCDWDDYVKVTRCFKCSKYNHRAQNCNGKQTCPKCTGDHILKDCRAKEENYKCINCITYVKYNKDSTIEVNHSALDDNCPCHQTALRRHRLNIDY